MLIPSSSFHIVFFFSPFLTKHIRTHRRDTPTRPCCWGIHGLMQTKHEPAWQWRKPSEKTWLLCSRITAMNLWESTLRQPKGHFPHGHCSEVGCQLKALSPSLECCVFFSSLQSRSHVRKGPCCVNMVNALLNVVYYLTAAQCLTVTSTVSVCDGWCLLCLSLF